MAFTSPSSERGKESERIKVKYKYIHLSILKVSSCNLKLNNKTFGQKKKNNYWSAAKIHLYKMAFNCKNAF